MSTVQVEKNVFQVEVQENTIILQTTNPVDALTLKGIGISVNMETISDGDALVYSEADNKWVAQPIDSSTAIKMGRSVPAGTAPISGHRAVMQEDGALSYASSDNLAHLYRVMGITTQAALSGDPAFVCISGEIIEPSWNWEVGKAVLLGLNGTLVQTLPPEAKFVMQLGIPLSPIKLQVEKKMPIILA